MANDIEDAHNFEISSVVSRTFEVIGANVPLYLGLSAVLIGVPSFATGWWRFENAIDWSNDDALFQAAMSPLSWLPYLVITAMALVAAAVLQAALTRATVLLLSDREPQFGDCLALGLSLIPQLVAITLISGVVIWLTATALIAPYVYGLYWYYGVELLLAKLAFGKWLILAPILLLMLPGLYVWICWSVAVPAYVQERVGAIEALRRSVQLTRGVRLRIFLVMAAVWTLMALLAIPAWMMGSASTGIGASPMTLALVSAGYSALTSMVSVTILTSIYVELRDVKEQIAPETLETIFA